MLDLVNNVCFVHIPKTGGQSIEHWFMQLRDLDAGEEGALFMFKNSFESGLPRASHHMTFAEYRDLVFGGELPDDLRVFAVVRDPLARLESELAYRFGGRIPPGALLRLRSLPVRSAFDDFRHHLKPQNEFLDGPQSDRIDILRLESLSVEFPRLMARYGLPATPLGHVNKSRKRDRRPLPGWVEDWAGDVYADDFERFGYPSPDSPRTAVAA